MDKDNLIDIEKSFWLEGADYYNQHIAGEATFVFPGMQLGKEDGVNSADQAPRWDDLDLNDSKLIKITEDVAVLTYHAEGKREAALYRKYIHRLSSGRQRSEDDFSSTYT